MNTIRILAVSHAANSYLFGSERSFKDACRALCSAGADVFICLPSNINTGYREDLGGTGHVVALATIDSWSNGSNLNRRAINDFSFLIWKYDIDCVYANTILTRSSCYAGKLLSRTVITHVREMVDEDASIQEKIGLSASEILHDIDYRSTFVVANSTATASMLRKHIEADKVFVAANGIDTSSFASLEGPNGGSIRVGIVSSNSRKKGIADFIKIAQWCHRHSVDVDFYIIGPINERIRSIQERVISGELSPRINVVGYIQKSIEAIGHLDILLSLSAFGESFGRSVAEAMAASRIVIAYSSGAIPDLIDDGVSGFLVEPGDFRQVARIIKNIVSAPSSFDSIRSMARDKVSRDHDIEIFNKSMCQLVSMVQRPKSISALSRRISIIITVHDAFEHFNNCISSVLTTIDKDCVRVIVVDDASKDPRVQQLITEFDPSVVQSIHIRQNVGYTSAVNVGVAAASTDDIILLNSDTVVTRGWLEGLVAAAYSQEAVGTVTSISNNAGAFSFPFTPVNLLEVAPRDLVAFSDAVLEALGQEQLVEVPTGSGFCMFIKRALINQIGLMNNESFPRGYGEENDFCQRAIKHGWKNVISPWSFVFHERSASFGADRTHLTKQGLSILQALHPNYLTEVKIAFNQSTLRRWSEKAHVATRNIMLKRPLG